MSEIKIIQQESVKNGVQQHLNRPLTEKTFCGIQYKNRKNWIDYNVIVELTDAHKHTSCCRCKKGAEVYVRNQKLNKRRVIRETISALKS